MSSPENFQTSETTETENKHFPSSINNEKQQNSPEEHSGEEYESSQQDGEEDYTDANGYASSHSGRPVAHRS